MNWYQNKDTGKITTNPHNAESLKLQAGYVFNIKKPKGKKGDSDIRKHHN